MKKGRISFAHGRALLEIEDVNQQRRLVHEIIANGLSVRELESLLKTYRPKISKRRMKVSALVEPYIAVLEEELQHILATKIRISKQKKRGRIVIEFYSQQDLERIASRIKGGKD
jgi:ParB family chromosome partitioning protein